MTRVIALPEAAPVEDLYRIGERVAGHPAGHGPGRSRPPTPYLTS